MKPRKIRLLGQAALGATLLVAAAGPGSSQLIHDRIYPAPTAPIATAPLPAGAQRVTVKTSDGLAITGAEIAPRPGKPTLLVFHGNASSAMGSLDWFAPLVAAGYGVVAAEYRGYSGNPGRADEAGLGRDADAFYAEARRLAGSNRVIVIGHSIGGGVAFGLAMRQKLDALVTIGTFTGLRAMAPKIARSFIADRYDNLAAVPKLDEPYFLIHGLADDTVPAAMGQELHKAAFLAKRDGFSAVIRGAGHHPDGAVIAPIIEAIAARLDHSAGATPPLPDTVKLIAFQ
ncbi:alpha/beta hydrolase [Sphingomonas sp. PAMC 26605]|uniref:alpha/beta hydrolase n=1 Tax=Sphingomonas sp. PAMC 26605 TaxID=1112214 RepID=UPI00026CD71B|nr:alpha/beta fold hydrolase [Sphingomonas sp. PAMC 26605]